MKLQSIICIFLCLFLFEINKGICSDSLVNFNTYWRYLDNGSTPPSNWTTLAYVDSSWDLDEAEFGYGDGDEATVISYGSDPNDKYITTYFRHEFLVSDVSPYKSLRLHLKRDDGAVVYINGNEVYRSNMPTGTITNSTLAPASTSNLEEIQIVITAIDISNIHNGYNLVSVELHQSSADGADASFDLALVADTTAQLVRGPYLQNVTMNSMMVCWRTSSTNLSKVMYGTTMNFTDSIIDTAQKVNHFINLSGLQPSTKYFYAIYSSDGVLHSDSDTYFFTSPDSSSNKPVRIWTMGDFGNGRDEQNETRDAYYNYTDTTYTNIFLMLGDNAYSNGSDEDYSMQVFKDHYEDLLKKTVVYSTCGNHELETSTAANQTGPYYDLFSFPVNGEGGGVPSGNEAYYSFDYGNIHFVCLESNVDTFGSANLAAMLIWLESDLAANSKKWIITYYHFPSLSKGYHDSDNNTNEIWCRENINPILEKYNVDLVLGGHSHDYERSHLLKGHFGLSSTLTPSMILNPTGGNLPNFYDKRTQQDSGTVYAVVGSSSEMTPIQSDWPHPAMYMSDATLYGSMVIDVLEDTMDVKFLTNTDSIADHFVFVKFTPVIPVQTIEIKRGPYLQIAAPTEMTVRWKTSHAESTRLLYGTNLIYSDSLIDTTSSIDHTARIQGLMPNTKYFYAIRLLNDSLVGDSSFYFYTPPNPGSILPVRFWAMGDFGTGDVQLNNVRDAYYNYSSGIYTNLLLWLGNNAYPEGSLQNYDDNVFPQLKSILKNSCVYSASGEIELNNANVISGTGDYFDLFNFPENGEAGGVASNSEAYYSFNYANIHFVVLETSIDSFGSGNLNAMINWLNADLTANSQKWKVILFHNPPYTKGSFDSDIESNMISCRTIILPVCESHNVDLILSSNSHNYERSFMIKDHYGPSTSFNLSAMSVDTTSGTPPAYYDKTLATTDGSVFVVVGSISDSLPSQPGWPHPIMYTYLDSISGSLVIDVYGDTLNAYYLSSANTIVDRFGIYKNSSTVGVSESPESATLYLYPDPVNSSLSVQYVGSDEKVTMSIYNSIGKKLKTKSINGKSHFETIDVRELKTGVYYIRMQGRNTNIIKRFVKN